LQNAFQGNEVMNTLMWLLILTKSSKRWNSKFCHLPYRSELIPPSSHF